MIKLQKPLLLSLVLIFAVFTAAGAAQKTGRYVLKQTGDGFVRLDTETGSVAHCAKQNNKWQCKGLTTGKTGPDPDVVRLKKQNNELLQRVARLEDKVRDLSSKAKKPGTKLDLPSSQDLDEVMGFFESLVSRLMQFVRAFQDGSGRDI